MNQDILAQTLWAIHADRLQVGYDRSFTAVNKLLNDADEEQLAERLDATIPHTWPWEDVAFLFTILIIWTNDDGAALLRTTDGWLREGTNLRRIQIALAQRRYPFPDAAEMEQVLNGIAQRFPEVADRCAELMAERKQMQA